MKYTTATHCLAPILAVVGLAATSHAQVRVEDGRALDANNRIGSGGFNDPARDFAREVRLRNAIVTGNAGGGASFRGDVGYTAEFDFRADTGFDDIFEFERDSAFSALASRDLRGIGDVRAQLGLTGGVNDAARTTFAISRPGAGVAAENIGQSTDARRDVFFAIDGGLRSTSRFLVRPGEVPETLGPSVSPSGETNMIVASPLAGVRPMQANDPALRGAVGDRPSFDIDEFINRDAPAGDRIPDVSDPRDEIDDDRISPRERPERPSNRVENAAETNRQDNRIAANRLGRERLLSDLFDLTPDPAVEDPDADPDDTQLPTDESDRLREADRILESLSDRLREGTELPRPVDRDTTRPGEDASDRETEGDETDEDAGDPRVSDEAISRALEALRERRTDVDTLAGGAPESSAIFNEHMEIGQRWLEEARWFDAEERFAAALSIDRDSIEARVGRIHAQLGGGMFTSAALNLRTLLRDYPELTSVRYDEKLLPRAERREQIVAALRERAAETGGPALDASILLAFLGFQADDQAMITEALDRIEQLRAEAGEEPTSLEVFLRRVWE